MVADLESLLITRASYTSVVRQTSIRLGFYDPIIAATSLWRVPLLPVLRVVMGVRRKIWLTRHTRSDIARTVINHDHRSHRS